MQEEFVVAYTTEPGCIGKIEQAALRAGYSPATAAEQGRRLVTLPHVKAAIRQATIELINAEYVVQAVQTLAILMNDPESPRGVRADCAKTLLDRAGIVAKVSDDKNKAKDIKDMTPDELASVVRQASEARAHLEARLKDITPDSAQIEGQAVVVTGADSQQDQ
jgi:hypothetical protein